MKIGTKSVLFGVHCFAIHWFFVARAWIKLYGGDAILHPMLWLSFIVHDLGYIGKPNMDGPEGETHVQLGANICYFISGNIDWYEFCLYHSRFYAKKHRRQFSKLCVADKLAICLYPRWLYMLLANATGEINEYMAKCVQNGNSKYAIMNISTASQEQWFADMCDYVSRWVAEHKDGRQDNWTASDRTTITDSGVWQ